MAYTLVCTRCNRDLSDWQIVANASMCSACYMAAQSELETQQKLQCEAFKDLLWLLVFLFLFAAALYMILWYPSEVIHP